jgi:hypothetical protein
MSSNISAAREDFFFNSSGETHDCTGYEVIGESLSENGSIRRPEKEITLRLHHITPEIYFVILNQILKESQLNRPLRKEQNVDNIEICQQNTTHLTTNSKL